VKRGDETRSAEEKSAEREGNEIAETRGDKRGEGEQIARKASVKGENEKRERASEGIEENKGNVQSNPPLHAAHPALEHDNGEEDTHREPQHEPRELEYEPTHGNTEVGNGLHETREGKDYRVREPNNGTTHPAPSPTANAATKPVPREHTRFDWATETNKSIGPVPNASDFRPTKPQSPLPVRTTPKRTVTQRNGNVAPRRRIPAMDATTTALPHVPAERAPTAIVHGPRDLSGLRSSTPNPWRSLHRRYYSHDSHTPRRFTGRRQYPPKYPTNTHMPATTISKTPALAPVRIFETVRHPLGIGPTKPIIRVPVSTTMDTPTHPAPLAEHAVVKPVPPLPQTRCECGRLIPGSEARKLPIVTPHHALSTFMSHIFSSPFFFPTHFFSRFRFS